LRRFHADFNLGVLVNANGAIIWCVLNTRFGLLCGKDGVACAAQKIGAKPTQRPKVVPTDGRVSVVV